MEMETTLFWENLTIVLLGMLFYLKVSLHFFSSHYPVPFL